MNIELDFDIIICDKGHENNRNTEHCSVCGETLEGVTNEKSYYMIREEKLHNVFLTIKNNREKIEQLKREIRENNVEVISNVDQNAFESAQFKKICCILENSVFENLSLIKTKITQDSFSQTERRLIEFFDSLYEPIENLLKYSTEGLYRKNSLGRLLAIAEKQEKTFVTILESAIQCSLEKAEEFRDTAQKLFDELTIEASIISRIYASHRIDSSYSMYINGGNNYAAIAAMLMFNRPEHKLDDIKTNMRRDTLYYFREHITKHPDKINFIDILFLSMYMNGSLLFSNEFMSSQKLTVSLALLNTANDLQTERLQGAFFRYKDTYIYMINKMREIQESLAFVTSNKPSEKVLLFNMIKWYKDICEGLYRDTAIFLYICCCLITDPKYADTVFQKSISFSDIVARFNSLNKKYQLTILTNGVNKSIRHAEAHVDYKIDYDKKVIHFINRKRLTEETLTFENFADLFNDLSETIMAMICSYEIFMINNDEFDNIVNDFHNELQHDIDIDQTDIAPLLLGIIAEERYEIIEGDKKVYSITGSCIDKEEFSNIDGILPILFVISKEKNEFDYIQLSVKNVDLHVRMPIELLNSVDLQDETSAYKMGVIRYIFSKQVMDKDDARRRLYDMYYNIFVKYLNKLFGINEIKKGYYEGKTPVLILFGYCKKLIAEGNGICELLYGVEMECDDKKLNDHCIAIIENISHHLEKLIEIDPLLSPSIYESISMESLSIIDLLKRFKESVEK